MPASIIDRQPAASSSRGSGNLHYYLPTYYYEAIADSLRRVIMLAYGHHHRDCGGFNVASGSPLYCRGCEIIFVGR
jgi:hypothetical protein